MSDNTEQQQQPPTEMPLDVRMLISMLGNAFDAYINLKMNEAERQWAARLDALVERRFNELVENTNTLAMLSDDLKTAITEIVDEAIDEHVDEVTHWSEGELDHNTEQVIDNYIRNTSAVVSEQRVAEIVRDELDERLDETLESKLENATLSICL